MLQSLRARLMGWRGVVIFGSLGLIMAIAFGVGNYTINNQATWVAKVGKHEISLDAFQQEMNNMRQQASEDADGQFDSAYFEQQDVKLEVLNRLIDRYLFKKAAHDLNMVVTNADVRREIANTRVFQVNGKFDGETYQRALANSGMSPGMFERRVRDDLETRLLLQALLGTGMMTPQALDDYLALADETRDISLLELPRVAAPDAAISEDDIKTYYTAHTDQFAVPEQVAVDYIELKAEDLDLSDELSDEALKARYEEEKYRYVAPEQRKVAHILIKVDADADSDAREAARSKAKDVAAKAREGDDFAELAKKYSDDKGSRNLGGMLGWLEEGVAGESFDDALQALQKGETSDPVASDDGYHIIKLVDTRAGETRPFADVRDSIAESMGKRIRARKFSELAGELTDLVYANPSSLEPAAEKLGLTIKHTDLFDRDGTEHGITAQGKVVQAAFSENVLTDDNSSDPILLSDTHVVVLHRARHEAARTRPMDEVTDDIKQAIQVERMNDAAQEQARKWLTQLNDGNYTLQDLAAELEREVEDIDTIDRSLGGIDEQLQTAVFDMAVPEKDAAPDYQLVHLDDGVYAIVTLRAVHTGDPDSLPQEQRQMLLGQLRQIYADTAASDWLEAMRREAKINIAMDRL